MLRILPLGDSLTWGVIDDNLDKLNDEFGGYRTVLQDSLEAAGFQNPTHIDFVGTGDELDLAPNGTPRRIGPRPSGPNSIDNDHQGQRGSRIDQLTRVLNFTRDDNEDGKLDFIAPGNVLLDVINPDIVLLMAGTNDFLRDTTASRALDRLEDLINTLATTAQDILVASLPPFVIGGEDDDANLDASDLVELESFNDQLPTFLQDADRFTADVIAKLTFVDVAAALETSDISSDGVHPTSLGFSKVATAWHNALVPILDPSIELSTIERGTPQRIELDAPETFNSLGDFEVLTPGNLPDNVKAIQRQTATGASTATTTFNLETGTYDVAIGYFDENDGKGQLAITIGDDSLTPITLDQSLGADIPSTSNYVRKTIGQSVQLNQGDLMSLTGTPDGGELIAVDYLEFIPVPATNSPNPSPSPSPTPDPSITPSPTPDPSITPSPAPDSSITPSPTPDPSITPSPTPDPSITPSPTPDPSITPTPTPDPSITPTPIPDSSITPSPAPDSSITPSPTPDSSITPSPTPEPIPSPEPMPKGMNQIGSNRNDRFEGTAGNDRFNGKNGQDWIRGGEGDDWVMGGKGRDRLFGDGGNDSLNGGKDGDRLVGGDGDDELTGGRGQDILQGGAGADSFIYTNRKDGG
ncbi:MAG: SGNH/GDSL hydrolase family protein, partial [Leptolyngbyaceae cyanobacterium]